MMGKANILIKTPRGGGGGVTHLKLNFPGKFLYCRAAGEQRACHLLGGNPGLGGQLFGGGPLAPPVRQLPLDPERLLLRAAVAETGRYPGLALPVLQQVGQVVLLPLLDGFLV
jgi:hypothetical protein